MSINNSECIRHTQQVSHDSIESISLAGIAADHSCHTLQFFALPLTLLQNTIHNMIDVNVTLLRDLENVSLCQTNWKKKCPLFKKFT